MPDKITATFATIPGREANARKVILDLMPQVNDIRVHTNGFIADFSYMRSVNNLGDAAKFAHGPDEGYWIVCDDDLNYAPDFADYLISKVEEYNREAVICLGGKRFDTTPIEHFTNGFTANHRILGEVSEDVEVHAPLTCGVAFHTDTIRPTLDDFPLTHKNMADLHFGRLCQRKGVPVICAAHEKGWITHQKIQTTTIWRETKKHGDELQTQLINATW